MRILDAVLTFIYLLFFALLVYVPLMIFLLLRRFYRDW